MIDSTISNSGGKALNSFHYIGLALLSILVGIAMFVWRFVLSSSGASPLTFLVGGTLFTIVYALAFGLVKESLVRYIAKHKNAFQEGVEYCQAQINRGQASEASNSYRMLAAAYKQSQTVNRYNLLQELFRKVNSALNTQQTKLFEEKAGRITKLIHENKLVLASLLYNTLLLRYHLVTKRSFITPHTKHELYKTVIATYRLYKHWDAAFTPKATLRLRIQEQTPIETFFELANHTTFNEKQIRAALKSYKKLERNYQKLAKADKEKAYTTITLAHHKEQHLIGSLLVKQFQERCSKVRKAIQENKKLASRVGYIALKLHYRKLTKNKHILLETKKQLYNELQSLYKTYTVWTSKPLAIKPFLETRPEPEKVVSPTEDKVKSFFDLARAHKEYCLTDKTSKALHSYKKLSAIYKSYSKVDKKKVYTTLKLAFAEEERNINRYLVEKARNSFTKIKKTVHEDKRFTAILQYLLLQWQYRTVKKNPQIDSETKDKIYEQVSKAYKHYTAWFGSSKPAPETTPEAIPEPIPEAIPDTTAVDAKITRIENLAETVLESSQPDKARKVQRIYKKLYHKYLTLSEENRRKVYDLVGACYKHQLALFQKHAIGIWQTQADTLSNAIKNKELLFFKSRYASLKKNYEKLCSKTSISLETKQELYATVLEIYGRYELSLSSLKKAKPDTESVAYFRKLHKQWQSFIETKQVEESKIAYENLRSTYASFSTDEKKQVYHLLTEIYHEQLGFDDRIKVDEFKTKAKQIADLVEENKLFRARLHYQALKLQYRKIRQNADFKKETVEKAFAILTAIYEVYKKKKADNKRTFTTVKKDLPEQILPKPLEADTSNRLKWFFKELENWKQAIKAQNETKATLSYKLLNSIYRKLDREDKAKAYPIISDVFTAQTKLINSLKVKKIKEDCFDTRKDILAGKLFKARIKYMMLLWKYHSLKTKTYLSTRTKTTAYNEISETYQYYQERKDLVIAKPKRRPLTNYLKTSQPIPQIAVLLLLIIGLGAITTQFGITGFTIYDDTLKIEPLNLTITDTGQYNISVPYMIDHLSLSGSMKGTGSVKAFIKYENEYILVIDSGTLREEEPSESTEEFIPIELNLTIESSAETSSESNTSDEDTTIENSAKEITTLLIYRSQSSYDNDNDGTEKEEGIVDLSVERSSFNWEVDESKLCTRWKVDSLDNENSSTYCAGSEQCCNFIDLAPTSENWNDVQYIYKGLHDSTENNIVSAQVLFVDYNLSLENPYSEIHTSDLEELPVKFVDTIIEFEQVCEESCLMEQINGSEIE
ncbi:MAG: hypothetical protein QGH47_02870, partial [Candidatus Woesearchaeota archaeon]|nr:hypothetical protein [Candidatus Woesearchaeota archaeon]